MGDRNPAITRRDLLAGVGVALATVPWRPTAAVSGQATPSLEYALAEPIDAARIARVGVYPALGISRVGNSLDWFLAPEVPGLPPVPDGSYKSGPNDIKKQAQRFRLFAFDAEGEVLGELTAADADIRWTVHVANTKAAWYGFSNPLDNGEKAPGLPGQRRNNAIVGNDARAKRLVINPGARSISGVSANADGEDPSAMFIAPFWETLEVNLGHLQTDESGRLIVVPGDGVSESATPNNPISNFADNDGWQDDWCDGPVRASVTFANGSTFEADPAWVVCCGPDFAPEIPPVVSLWDVMTEVAIDAGWMEPPPRPLSFREHLYPIFR
ncbi:MAG: LodA/GoxA family CTQ-dependent oxidase, partial [Chloroflexota bacterium]